MKSDDIKAKLEDSAHRADPDQHWEAAAVDRLYFHDPDDLETAGAVDVQRGDDIERVKVELWVKPDTAAKIIAMVTRKLQPLPIVKRTLGIGGGGLKLKASKPLPAPIVQVRVEKTAIEIADEKRNAELKILIAQQEAEEAEEEACDA